MHFYILLNNALALQYRSLLTGLVRYRARANRCAIPRSIQYSIFICVYIYIYTRTCIVCFHFRDRLHRRCFLYYPLLTPTMEIIFYFYFYRCLNRVIKFIVRSILKRNQSLIKRDFLFFFQRNRKI